MHLAPQSIRLKHLLTATVLLAASLAGGFTAATEPAGKYPPPAEVKAAFLKQLDRPRIPLDPRTRQSERDADGRITEYISIASEKKTDGSVERVPMLIVRPESAAARLPAVIVLHGTGGNKESQRA